MSNKNDESLRSKIKYEKMLAKMIKMSPTPFIFLSVIKWLTFHSKMQTWGINPFFAIVCCLTPGWRLLKMIVMSSGSFFVKTPPYLYNDNIILAKLAHERLLNTAYLTIAATSSFLTLLPQLSSGSLGSLSQPTCLFLHLRPASSRF